MEQISIEGMTCQHCVSAVTAALEGAGLRNVLVDLASGKAVFAPNGLVTEAQIRRAVSDTGFTMTAIK